MCGAVTQTCLALEHAAGRLRADKQQVMRDALRCQAQPVRADAEFVLAAVTRHDQALQYAGEDLAHRCACAESGNLRAPSLRTRGAVSARPVCSHLRVGLVCTCDGSADVGLSPPPPVPHAQVYLNAPATGSMYEKEATGRRKRATPLQQYHGTPSTLLEPPPTIPAWYLSTCAVRCDQAEHIDLASKSWN